MGDYGYANARLRAMRGRLLDRPTLLEMAAAPRVEDVIARLAQTPYADAVHDALGRYGGVRVIMEAARLHLAAVLARVRIFYDEDGARLVDVLLARWDLTNLKAVLRGHAAGARAEDILAALTPVGALGDEALRLLARQPDAAATLDALRLWHAGYARLVATALDRARGGPALDLALDREFYARLLDRLDTSADDSMVRAVLTWDIDAGNVLTALRLRPAALDPARLGEWFIGGGRVTEDDLVQLAMTTSTDEALRLLQATHFGPALAAAETLDSLAVQHALDRARVRLGESFFGREPLSIAPAIGYIAAQAAETANVRLVGQAVAVGLPPATVARDLLGV